MEQDEPGDGKHSTGSLSDHNDAEDKTYKPVSGEENSPDDDAHIIPKKHLEQEHLHRRLIATARSLKKHKQWLKAAQDTLNHRWNKVLNTNEIYGGDRHTKSYPKRKLLPEFDDEAADPILPKKNTAIRPDQPIHGRDKATTDVAHDLHELLDKKAGAARSIYGSRGHAPTRDYGHHNDRTDRILVRNQHRMQQQQIEIGRAHV